MQNVSAYIYFNVKFYKVKPFEEKLCKVKLFKVIQSGGYL